MAETRPHVVVFPLPFQGPVNSMLKLAELLCLSDFQVTLLLTEHIHRRISHHSDIQSRFSSYPGFQIRLIADGLPENHPRGHNFLELIDSMRINTKFLFKEMLRSESSPVSCIVADGAMGFTGDVGLELGIPFFYLRSVSPSSLWISCCLQKLIEAGEIPFKGNDLDVPIRGVPGMESFLRQRDLPSFCRSGDVSNPHIQWFKTEEEELPRANGIILNTFMELDFPILDQFRSICPNIYAIGPLHAHLKSKLEENSGSSSSNSLWKEDRTCLKWLDEQPPKSVIYVSFGSLAVITNDQLIEFWHGLINSGHKFLWVIRPDTLSGKESIQKKAQELPSEKGYIVGWAPQLEVLAHPAVAGFLTHSGWNSTLESIYEGVPMICWPYFVDQQVNSRMVQQWKLGLDIKDTCDRRIIEEAVRDLMERRKDEFHSKAAEMSIAAKTSLGILGSSHLDFMHLVKDIRSLSLKPVWR